MAKCLFEIITLRCYFTTHSVWSSAYYTACEILRFWDISMRNKKILIRSVLFSACENTNIRRGTQTSRYLIVMYSLRRDFNDGILELLRSCIDNLSFHISQGQSTPCRILVIVRLSSTMHNELVCWSFNIGKEQKSPPPPRWNFSLFGVGYGPYWYL